MTITPETSEKEEFTKLSVKSNVKHEIDIIAATERRFVYEVVDDMLKLYKTVAMGKSLSKKEKYILIADVISNHKEKTTS